VRSDFPSQSDPRGSCRDLEGGIHDCLQPWHANGLEVIPGHDLDHTSICLLKQAHIEHGCRNRWRCYYIPSSSSQSVAFLLLCRPASNISFSESSVGCSRAKFVEPFQDTVSTSNPSPVVRFDPTRAPLLGKTEHAPRAAPSFPVHLMLTTATMESARLCTAGSSQTDRLDLNPTASIPPGVAVRKRNAKPP
jgi:hypothetical protein